MMDKKETEDLIKETTEGQTDQPAADTRASDAAGQAAAETPGDEPVKDQPEQEPAAAGSQPTDAASDHEEDEMIFARKKIKNLEMDNKKLGNELEALKERLLRLSAEYENFRKRTIKEKEELAANCTASLLKDILPVIDNLERALVTETDDLPGLKEGVQMTLDHFVQVMKKVGVEEIPTDQSFDPNYHEAVMHEIDADKGAKEISEVFLRGYKIGDKVIRHTVVKVVN